MRELWRNLNFWTSELLKDGIVNGVLRSYDVFVMSWWDIPVGFPDGPSAPPRIHPKHLILHLIRSGRRSGQRDIRRPLHVGHVFRAPLHRQGLDRRGGGDRRPIHFSRRHWQRQWPGLDKKQFLALLWIILTVTILVVHIYREIIYSVIRLFVSLIFMHWLIRSFIQSCINSVLH